MPSDDQELKAVKGRLDALVRCVLNKAEADESFGKELKKILLTDTLRSTIRKKAVGGTNRPVLDPVATLAQNGVEVLQRELSEKPTSELRQVARMHRILGARAIKASDRDALIDALLSYAKRKLDQGGVFNRSRNEPADGPREQE